MGIIIFLACALVVPALLGLLVGWLSCKITKDDPTGRHAERSANNYEDQ